MCCYILGPKTQGAMQQLQMQQQQLISQLQLVQQRILLVSWSYCKFLALSLSNFFQHGISVSFLYVFPIFVALAWEKNKE